MLIYVVSNKYTNAVYGIFNSFADAVVEQAAQNGIFGFEPGNDPARIKLEINYEFRNFL